MEADPDRVSGDFYLRSGANSQANLQQDTDLCHRLSYRLTWRLPEISPVSGLTTRVLFPLNSIDFQNPSMNPANPLQSPKRFDYEAEHLGLLTLVWPTYEHAPRARVCHWPVGGSA